VKKNGWILLLLLLIGLIGGSLVSRWLEAVPGLDFLTKAYNVSGSTAADLLAFNYNIHFGLNVSLLSIVGAVLAIWVYRKM
jgi:hypothetical protein